jgi:hypothetical protein
VSPYSSVAASIAVSLSVSSTPLVTHVPLSISKSGFRKALRISGISALGKMI